MMLTLLREKIRVRGFTQLKVQDALDWGRTYISQLFRQQKSLRFDQILQILHVIEVDAGEFFEEYFRRVERDHQRSGLAPFEPLPPPSASPLLDILDDEPPLPVLDPESVRQLRTTMERLTELLVEKEVITVGELEAAVGKGRRGQRSGR